MTEDNPSALQVAEAAARLQNDLDLDPVGKPQFKGGFTKWLDKHKDDIALVLKDKGPIRLAEILRADPARFSRWRIRNGLQENASEAQKARHERASTPEVEAPNSPQVVRSPRRIETKSPDPEPVDLTDDGISPDDSPKEEVLELDIVVGLRREVAKLDAKQDRLRGLTDAMRVVLAHFEESS